MPSGAWVTAGPSPFTATCSGDRASPSFHQSVLLDVLAYLVEHNEISWAAEGGGFWWYHSEPSWRKITRC